MAWRGMTDTGKKFSQNLQDWVEALDYGAFDVLDALHELPRVAESVKSAAWAAYLKGAGQPAVAIGPPRAA